MGNFSRDPKSRLAHLRRRHYAGVRLQQGVPLLDADWNLLDDLHRLEREDLGKYAIGNGAPSGSGGFRIVALRNGGVNTLVLQTPPPAGAPGWSSLRVDVATSTAAAALGFDARNDEAVRFGTAQLVSNRAEPFTLAVGSTLVLQIDSLPPETVTFAAANFANIAAATAAEVAAVITNATAVNARAGTGSDFIIKGGNSAQPGRLLIDGQMVLNENDLLYSAQPLYENPDLAELWNAPEPDPALWHAPVVPALATPMLDEVFVAYLDVWNRDVTSVEDDEMVDNRIGVETTVRLRREWTVRVARLADFTLVMNNIPEGHSFYPLAELHRIAGNAAISTDMIVDLRETDLSVQREIAYLSDDDVVLVNSARFKAMLTLTRDNIREFIVYLTTQFIPPNTSYFAGEMMGIEALSAVASLADHGIALLNTQSMGTRGAFAFFDQLLAAEIRLVKVWKDVVLNITKPGGKSYRNSFSETINRVEALLAGAAPPTGLLTITTALQRRNLLEAVRSQERVNTELGSSINRPEGFLRVAYLGSPKTTPIAVNEVFDLRYQISGSVTPQDDIDIVVNTAAGWTTTLKNRDGSVPLALKLGPGEDTDEILVTVRAPNAAAASSPISLNVNSRRNPSGILVNSLEKVLTVGSRPPLGEQDFAITLFNASVVPVNGIYQVPANLAAGAVFTFRVENKTPTDIPVRFVTTPPVRVPAPTPNDWFIGSGFNPNNNLTIAAGGNRQVQCTFVPPTAQIVGSNLTFTMRVRDANLPEGSPAALLAEIQVRLVTTDAG